VRGAALVDAGDDGDSTALWHRGRDTTAAAVSAVAEAYDACLAAVQLAGADAKTMGTLPRYVVVRCRACALCARHQLLSARRGRALVLVSCGPWCDVTRRC
jgi:hypothetical protein